MLVPPQRFRSGGSLRRGNRVCSLWRRRRSITINLCRLQVVSRRIPEWHSPAVFWHPGSIKRYVMARITGCPKSPPLFELVIGKSSIVPPHVEIISGFNQPTPNVLIALPCRRLLMVFNAAVNAPPNEQKGTNSEDHCHPGRHLNAGQLPFIAMYKRCICFGFVRQTVVVAEEDTCAPQSKCSAVEAKRENQAG